MGLKQERLNNLDNQINALECTHPKTEIRKRGPHYCWQCFRCGAVVGQWIPRNRIVSCENVPPFDDGLQERYRATVRELKTELYQIKSEVEKTNFHEWYQEYLLTPEWAEKRRLVLQRCDHVCEGCRSANATEVHHLAYTNVGHEFLFELVGLCHNCHDSIHNPAEQAVGND